MRKLTLFALVTFLFLWGIKSILLKNKSELAKSTPMIEAEKLDRLSSNDISKMEAVNKKYQKSDALSNDDKIRELDKIGEVINEKTANIDQDVKEQIKKDKIQFDNNQNLKEKVAFLEQSYLDKQTSIKDIKRIQSTIQDLKGKMKIEIQNTEKWDPMFVYYLMISENYTYSEINQIKSLAENGIAGEELNYINDLIKQESFKQQVLNYKSQGEVGRVVASLKKPKVKDEFVDSPNEAAPEDKLIEMNYGQIERE